MPEKVSGYLTKDGRFYEDFDLCRLEDAKLSLTEAIKGGIKQLSVDLDDFYDILHLYPEQVYEYVSARGAILDKEKQTETEDDEPNTRPIEVEK